MPIKLTLKSNYSRVKPGFFMFFCAENTRKLAMQVLMGGQLGGQYMYFFCAYLTPYVQKKGCFVQKNALCTPHTSRHG